MIGSHNSFSYLPVKQWWLKPFAFVGKCQSKDILEQLGNGIQCIDLRIKFDKFGNALFSHGFISYSFEQEIESFLRSLIVNIKSLKGIRLILEDSNSKMRCESETLFKDLCASLVLHSKLNNKPIRFFGGNRRSDWKQVVCFEDSKVEATQPVGSMSNVLIGKIWPWLWNKIYGPKSIDGKLNDAELILYDFI